MPELNPGPGGLKPRSGAKPHASEMLSDEDKALMEEIEKHAGKPEALAMVQIQASLRMAKAMEDMSAAVLDMADMMESICGHFNIDLDKEPPPVGGEKSPDDA
jgi:hypothetical protein